MNWCNNANETTEICSKILSVFDYFNKIFYLQTLYNLWWPTLISLIVLPILIIILLYVSSFLTYIYGRRERVASVVHETLEKGDPLVGGRNLVSLIWDFHGWLLHDYEISGLENLPDGGALIVYYHGALPIDAYYLTSRVALQKKRVIHSVGDKFLYKIPGWRSLLEAFHITVGSVSNCIQTINDGNLLTISPGGVREALFSDHTYQLLWGTRMGYARVAIGANCPIIPMFTENIREAFRTFCWPRCIFLHLYEKYRLPLVPIFGGFPVKLRTHLGAPLYPKEDESPEELAVRIQAAVQELIIKHQKVPGNIFRALIHRLKRKSS